MSEQRVNEGANDDAEVDDDIVVDATWILSVRQLRWLTAGGLSQGERLRRALLLVEALAAGDDADDAGNDAGAGGAPMSAHDDERIIVKLPLTIDELARTWPDARTPFVDPWVGDGDVDRANACARRWTARFLLRAVDAAASR